MAEDSQLIGLADFIQQLKADLAPREEQDEPLFYIDSIELEAQIVASQEQTGKAGLKLSILNFGADAGVGTKNAETHTQKLKISLSPILSKEELKGTLSEEEKQRMESSARQRVMRGGGAAQARVRMRGG